MRFLVWNQSNLESVDFAEKHSLESALIQIVSCRMFANQPQLESTMIKYWLLKA